jgi:His-Xaa-Ser system protein HxsD
MVKNSYKNKDRVLRNIEIDRKNNFLTISVNSKIYPLEIIYSASYVFLDRAYILIDGNPQGKIFIQMKPKSKTENLENLGNDFNNELLNYAVYVVQAVRNQPLRKAIIERALVTNLQKEVSEKDEEYCEKCGCELILCEECGEKYCPTCEKHEEESEPAGEDFVIDDPLGIAKPWTPPKEAENEKPENRQKKKKS